ncbi:MAG: hypothetical protein ACRDQF_11110 [Thermocrispum sp.]
MSQPTNQPRWPELRDLRPGVIPLGPLSMSEIFTATLDTLRRHAALLFGTSLVVLAVTRVLVNWLTAPMLRDLPRLPARPTQGQFNEYLFALMPISGIDTAISTLALVFISGIATVAVGRAVLGQPISFGEAAADLKPRILPLIGLTLLVSLVVALGLLALVVPGVWLAILLALAAPALVLERCTIVQALTRSRELVRNHWWRIFGILALVFVVILGVNALAVTITGDTIATEGLFGLPLLGEIIAGALTAPFAAVVTALIYVDRRFHTDDLALELARAAGLK